MNTNRGLRFALCAGLLLAPLATLPAQDMMGMGDEGFYATINYGVSLPAELQFDHESDDKFNTEFGFLGGRLGVGYAIFGFRPELSAGYRVATIKKDSADNQGTGDNFSVTSLDVIASVYYDVDTGTPLTPYVGAGGGMSSITIRRGETGTGAANQPPSAWAIAFQGAAGVGYDLTDALTVTLGYRLTGTLETEFTLADKSKSKLKLALGHNGELGLRVRF